MKKLLIIPLLVISLLASASNWYIAADGNDETGTGSPDYPWATFYKASTSVTTFGDTVFSQAGTYTETSQSSFMPGVSIVALGQVKIIAGTALNPVFNFNTASGNSIDGTAIISGIEFDGNSLTGVCAIKINFRSNITVRDCYLHDFLYNGIWIDGTASIYNTTPTNTLATNNSIINCQIINCTQYAGNSTSGCIRFEGTSALLIDSCILDQRGRIDGENADVIAGYQNYGLQILHTTFVKNDLNGTGWNFFAEIHYSHGGMEFAYCNFLGAACFDFSGSQKGTYDYGGWFHHNNFINEAPPPAGDHFQPAIDLESFDYEDDIIVERNYFKHPRIAIWLNNCQISSDNVTIRLNVIEGVGNTTNNYSSAIIILSNWNDAIGVPFSNIKIQNNTITAALASYAGIHVSAWGNITNLDIQNNIINGVFGRPIRFTLNGSGTPTIYNPTVTNNDFYGNTTTSVYYDGAVTYDNLIESNNITGDPMVRSSTDLRLQEGSSCINAGINIGLTSDYLGHSIIGLPDIGAYEWRSNPILVVGSQGVYHNGQFVLNNL
jgi:hypothetical protein